MLLSLPLMSACGNSGSTSHESTTSSEETKQDTNPIEEAEKFASDDKFYQAQDVLDKAKKDSKYQKNSEAFLAQIDLYKKAENAYNDNRYDVASDNINKVIDQKDGSSVMKDKADKLKEKIEKAKDDEESKSEQKTVGKSEEAARNQKSKHISGGTVGEEKSSWTSAKTADLNQFMDSWAKEMGQTYYELSFGERVITLGNYSIDDLVNGSVTPMVSGHPTTFSFDKSGAYEVVAAYDGSTNDGTDTAYVFAIGPGGPVALVAQGLANGENGSINFKPTANTNLQGGFANIANR